MKVTHTHISIIPDEVKFALIRIDSSDIDKAYSNAFHSVKNIPETAVEILRTFTWSDGSKTTQKFNSTDDLREEYKSIKTPKHGQD